MPNLILTDPHRRRKSVSVEEGKRYTVGRADACDVVLADPSLSRTHAEVYFEDGKWRVADRGSSNGTFIGGRRIEQPEVLEPGVEVQLGGCMLRLRDGERQVAPLPVSGGTVMMSLTDALGESHRPGESVPGQLEATQKRLAIAQRAMLELLAHEPLEELLPKVLDLVIEALRSDRAALLLEEDGELVQRAVRGQDGEELSVSRTIANTVLDKQVSVLTADAGTDERFEGGQSIAIQGIRAAMAVPLWNNERVIGLIYADSRMSRRTFDEDDLKLLTMLGNVAAIQIENSRLFADQLEKRRLANEARTAASIQERLLPGAPPEIAGYRLLGATVPCYEVGGDYYDWLELGDERRGFILGDVAGKGMGAALIMAAVQATIHARVDSGPTAGELVARLNDAVDRSAPDERFVTVLYADLDLAANRLDCVNAGHAPTPLVVRANGELVEIPASGPPLGIIAGYEHTVQPIELGPGDFLFICSDGVTEATNSEGEMFGDDRLHQVLIAEAGKSPQEVRAVLERELAAHVRDTDADDDVTVLIVQRNP